MYLIRRSYLGYGLESFLTLDVVLFWQRALLWDSRNRRPQEKTVCERCSKIGIELSQVPRAPVLRSRPPSEIIQQRATWLRYGQGI